MFRPVELSPKPTCVGELFSEIHDAAYDAAKDIPSFDELRGEPGFGEIYAHRTKLEYPSCDMPLTETVIRIAEKGTASYLLGIHSLRPSEQSSATLPYLVRTYGHVDGGNEVVIKRQSPNGIVAVELAVPESNNEELYVTETGYYPVGAKIDELPMIDKERLDITAKNILAITGTLHYLLDLKPHDRPAALAELDIPTLHISKQAWQKSAVDPRLVEIQIAIAQAHPELANDVFSLDLTNAGDQLVLALGGEAMNSGLGIDISTKPTDKIESPASRAKIAKLIKDLLNNSDLPERNN